MLSNYKGIFIDTNLFLLLLVGLMNESWISRVGSTKPYSIKEFRWLNNFLNKFETVYITPHVLAEVSHHTFESDNFFVNNKAPLRRLLQSLFETRNKFHEFCPQLNLIVNNDSIFYLGVTDISLWQSVISKEHPLITADGPLAGKMVENDLPVFQFLPTEYVLAPDKSKISFNSF